MAYADYNDLMTFTEELLVKVAQDIGLGKWKFLKVILIREMHNLFNSTKMSECKSINDSKSGFLAIRNI